MTPILFLMRCFRVFVLCVVALSPAVASAQSPFGATGSRGGRALDSALPNEAVDPFSGTLSIVETDLVLPGNAGLDVRVQRVYSSAIYPGYNTNDLTVEEDSWAGIGWKLHFGRVINPDVTTGGVTQIEMGDGSRHALYTTSVSPGWTTKSYWLYDRATHTLKLPNGLVYEFGHVVNLGGTLGTARYVTVIRDPFNNRIEFQYFVASFRRATQTIPGYHHETRLRGPTAATHPSQQQWVVSRRNRPRDLDRKIRHLPGPIVIRKIHGRLNHPSQSQSHRCRGRQRTFCSAGVTTWLSPILLQI